MYTSVTTYIYTKTSLWVVTSMHGENHIFKLTSSKEQIHCFKDAMPVSFRSKLFTSYILTIFKQ